MYRFAVRPLLPTFFIATLFGCSSSGTPSGTTPPDAGDAGSGDAGAADAGMTSNDAGAADAGASTDAGGLCDAGGTPSHNYMMAFQVCDADGGQCNNPQNHKVYLAGSNDGASWSLISSFAGFPGSVPEIVYYNSFVHIVYANAVSTDTYRRVNACFQTVATGSVTIDAGAGSSEAWVDPSLVVSGNDLVMFYLYSEGGGDPASCSPYPCTKRIRSAKATAANPTRFEKIDGDRVAITIDAGGFSDPDVVVLSYGGIFLYTSNGENTYVYTAATLNGAYTAPDGGAGPTHISLSQGGVPSAIEAPDGGVWLYVNSSVSGVGQIRRAFSPNGVALDGGFTTVVTYQIGDGGFSSQTSTSGAAVIRWPGSDWSRATQ